ncbi:helix-turn-helix domain-containing protein [Epilithonimonas sp. JDS]|uniref:helix-turn-helix domain-containing protein n=1 Tax=Epilithonimonas sp. JDS TaxID=2902797 RepID=UPI001E56D5EC|nr:helix-turn-helix domain-containing protein [Epilithonimonas sp. JDS]MCD9855719.1 helix-turn-helix domain-containing protein [Epilithonimonas sp. JDS]
MMKNILRISNIHLTKIELSLENINFQFKIKYIITIFTLIIFSDFSAQIGKEIDVIFKKTQEFQHPSKSIKMAYELLRMARKENDPDKIKFALFTIGNSYYRLGEHSKALEYCNMAIAEDGSDDYFSKIYSTRVKSFVLLDLNMTDKSLFENKRAFVMASKIRNKNTDDYYKLIGLLWRDKGVYYTDNDSILKYDQKNVDAFLKLKKYYKGSANLSMPYNNVGYDYLMMGKLDSALVNYRKAEFFARKSKDEFNLAFVFQSYAEYYDELGTLDSAIAYRKKSLEIANKFKEYRLAKVATFSIRELYIKKGDGENSLKYDKLYSSLSDSIDVIRTRELNDVLAIIEKEKELEKKKSDTQKYWIIGFLLLLALLISLYAVYQYRKNKKDYIKFTKLIEGIENKASSEDQHEAQQTEIEKQTSSNISDVKEHELMKKLNNFEKKEQFLSPEISLSSMASSFNTNVNYLSKIIKKYRDNNFSSYINELRINYITRKLKSNPEYLNYKISYLAEECGFTSYSSFVSIFKQQTGITPSKFIDYLREELIKTNQNDH